MVPRRKRDLESAIGRRTCSLSKSYFLTVPLWKGDLETPEGEIDYVAGLNCCTGPPQECTEGGSKWKSLSFAKRFARCPLLQNPYIPEGYLRAVPDPPWLDFTHWAGTTCPLGHPMTPSYVSLESQLLDALKVCHPCAWTPSIRGSWYLQTGLWLRVWIAFV